MKLDNKNKINKNRGILHLLRFQVIIEFNSKNK